MKLFRSLLLSMALLAMNSGTLRAAGYSSTTNQDNDSFHCFGYPIIYSTPESGFALGGYFMAYRNSKTSHPRDNLDSFDATAIYTEKKQSILTLNSKKYLNDDRHLLTLQGGYTDYPNEFYGIGPDTGDRKEDYTYIAKSFQGSFLWRLNSHTYLGPNLTYANYDIEDRIPGGLLAAGNITGFEGTNVAGAGLKLLFDTRDNGFLPRNGALLNAQANVYRRDLGSDEDFSQLLMTHCQFYPIGQTSTLALMAELDLSEGAVPFEMLPALGGSIIMRGYYYGRYRDRNYAAFQGEYRFPIGARFSGVAFAALGEVAPEIDQFDFNNFKAAGGFGIRFRIDPRQKINLRCDLGFSEAGVSSYIAFMEAF